MTDTPPKRKDPRQRTPVPLLPPAQRSRAALGLTLAAAEGRFALQGCAECGAVQYPPRDACRACLSTDLTWREVPNGGRVVAQTRIHASPDPYFREHLPWRIGTVALDAGVPVIAHLHAAVSRGDRVRMALRLDRAGQGVLIALPDIEGSAMTSDPTLRAMGTDPRHRRVLITDARAPESLALTKALLAAGAAEVRLGEPETWKAWDGRAAFDGLAAVSLHPLDVTDTGSVRDLAAGLGGKVDILINTARHERPGGVMTGDLTRARDEIEVGYMGLMRLAQAFGPAMAARAADGVNSAAAWVNILPVQALAHDPGFASTVAAGAAARALALSLRAELRGAGVRVMNAYTGPLDDDWHQPLPPPKVAPKALAQAIVAGLCDGLEEVHVGDIARDLADRWRRDPRLLAREMEGGLS
jgi:uncharacterized OB-fold protein/NAD(P)-dependent dehydrogenase (short-subunit alcohol dehydrogenase family)